MQRSSLMRNSAYIIKEPLSEATMLYLYELLLTNGVHYIQMQGRGKGRNIFYFFLNSFFVYKKTGCLTLNDFMLSPRVSNIYTHLADAGYLNSNETGGYDLDGFFHDQCHFDFLLIEKDIRSADTHLLDNFENMIISYQLGRTIPIFIVHYA